MKKICKSSLLTFGCAIISLALWILGIVLSPTICEGFTHKEFRSGDAKFFGDKIITSKDGLLCILNMAGEIIKHYDNIPSAWIDTVDEDKVIISGNWDKEINLIKIDDDLQVRAEYNILCSDKLMIDPAIIKIKDTYYLSVTEIDGTVNNSDPTVENGVYTVHFYSSKDLEHWILLSDVICEKANIEDVDLLYYNNCIYVCYEKETVDKGNSEIDLRCSDDFGKTWSDEYILLPPDCDHEPVCFAPLSNGFLLMYSSDKDHPGESYQGGKAYYTVFDCQFEARVRDKQIPTKTKEGLLWYDYMELSEKSYFLFAGNYLSTNDLIMEANDSLRYLLNN